ncbi:hypothetical protein R3X26_15750 [Vibrio sp. TH_r3]|uniref:hypothetical protein n=1 Tax=Vibrio sp. TH_r3 TaxID=3082084 RepID=UPI002954FCB4|nr:hypothetical protein [Vibrio sp. TH_r3]MDV7105859.1 hypothetical protein [Vibrio sp. TH_r3]
MKLNKITLAAALVASSITVAHASSDTVNFVGVVTSVTCDVSIEVGGVDTPSNIVDLGTIATSSTGSAVEFTIISEATTGGECAATKGAEVTWSGPTMTATGFDNSASATATGTTMTLTGKPATGDVAITSTTTVVPFTSTEVGTGMPFEAKMTSSTTPGQFNTTATYSVAYL